MVYTLGFFLFKMQFFFHNSNVFGCTFYVQSVLKFKKIIPAPKG